MYLFNEPPVSEAEVQAWLDSVPNLSAAPFRREAYRKAYRVEEKIRNEKLKALSIPGGQAGREASSSR